MATKRNEPFADTGDRTLSRGMYAKLVMQFISCISLIVSSHNSIHTIIEIMLVEEIRFLLTTHTLRYHSSKT